MEGGYTAPGRRYTVREASEILRISQHAIRQRIRRNTLDSLKDADGRVYVLLEQDAEPSDKASGEQSGVDLVQMLREHNQVLREQLDEAHAANRENRRIIAALTSRVPGIEAPRDERDAPETASDGEASTETPADDTSEPRASSWWKRFFGFE